MSLTAIYRCSINLKRDVTFDIKHKSELAFLGTVS